MKFPIFKNKKLPLDAKKGLLPRAEFLAQGKERFLAAFDASPLASRNAVATGVSARTSGWAMFFRVGAGTLAAVAVAFGVSAYAATATNVPPTSPFYPLKRIAENVQLAVAPAQDKAQLQATFAVQRANEIDALQVQHPTSTLIPQLTNDLDTEISSSLAEANQYASPSSTSSNGNGEEGAVSVFCGAFVRSTSSVLFGHLESGLVLHPNILTQFNEQCGSESVHNGGNGYGGTATGANTTTTPAHPERPVVPGSGGSYHRGRGEGGSAASSTADATATVPASTSGATSTVVATTSATATFNTPSVASATTSASSSGSVQGDDNGSGAGASAGAGSGASAHAPVPPVSIPSLGGIL